MNLELSQEIDKGISEKEVRRAVNRLKAGKAPGTCVIMPEMLISGGGGGGEKLLLSG